LKILIASKNKGKIREIREIINLSGIEFLSINDIDKEIPDIIESGQSYMENALIKAKAISELTGINTLSDDSGIEIEYLQGCPGVKSARFPTSESTDEERCLTILYMLKNVSVEKRSAKFVCEIILFLDNGKLYLSKGECKGDISEKMRGDNGFGYDPIFIPAGYDKTFAELCPDVKNKISHRFKALIDMKNIISNLNSNDNKEQ
jgi:XTP/dITP diphosphohydrolase